MHSKSFELLSAGCYIVCFHYLTPLTAYRKKLTFASKISLYFFSTSLRNSSNKYDHYGLTSIKIVCLFYEPKVIVVRVKDSFCSFVNKKESTETATCTLRSSHQRCFIKKGVLKNFAKFTGKQLHRCFLVNFVKFSRTPFLQNTTGDCFWGYWKGKPIG